MRLMLPVLIIPLFIPACAIAPTDPVEAYLDDPIAHVAIQQRRRPASAELATPTYNEVEVQRGLQAGELTLGMGIDDVMTVWGQPIEVQTAGDPEAGNQKWVYHNGLSDQWRTSTRRVVYFEAGRVAGWETQ